MILKSFIKKSGFFIIPFLVLLSAMLLFQVLSCSRTPVQTNGSSPDNSNVLPLKIVTSIIPSGEFIKKIGKDRVDVTVMVPQGSDPHTYEPAPGQLKALSTASIYAKVGSGLEFELAWLEKLVSVNPDIFIADLSEGVSPIYNGENAGEKIFKKGADPHIWLSPKNVKIIAGNIFMALSEIDSGGRSFYRDNLDIFIGELDALDQKIREGLESKNNKMLIVYHPAWAYFAKDYGLIQVTVEEEGKEPTASELASIISLAKENNIKVIFASPQFNPKSAEVIANEIDGTVVFIDPLGPDYMKNMEIVLESLKKYLQ